jgi:hypothetical protein
LPWRWRLPDRRQRLAPSARPLWRGEPPPCRSRTLFDKPLRHTGLRTIVCLLWGKPGEISDTSTPSPRSRAANSPTHRMCSSSSHEWDTEAFGATYLASLNTPAFPIRF